MFPAKRSYTQTKSNVHRYSKGKDVPKQSTSCQKPPEMPAVEVEPNIVNFPIIRQSDNAKLLQRYNAILARSTEDGVSMDDLDQLQQDFEKLLSTCAVRNRILRAEVEPVDGVEAKGEKNGKPIDKPSLKRKLKKRKLNSKKKKNSFNNDMRMKQEVLPWNDDTSDQFWLSIEPYCTDVSKDDVNFLDDLIQECSQNINVKIPEVGEHYATEWAESTLNQEQNLSTIGGQTKTKTISFTNDLKKNGLNAMVDTFSSPLTQRLLAALLEEKVISSYPTAFDKLKDFTLKNNNGARGGICLDRRLRRELVEQGILEPEDLHKTYPPDDDILLEIKKCQQELSVVNEHNMKELEKLRTTVAKDIRKQEVKAALNKVDTKVMTMYNNILLTKQKPVTSAGNEETPDKLNPLLSREYEDEANKIIKQQILLHRELSELTDFTMLQ